MWRRDSKSVGVFQNEKRPRHQSFDALPEGKRSRGTKDRYRPAWRNRSFPHVCWSDAPHCCEKKRICPNQWEENRGTQSEEAPPKASVIGVKTNKTARANESMHGLAEKKLVWVLFRIVRGIYTPYPIPRYTPTPRCWKHASIVSFCRH